MDRNQLVVKVCTNLLMTHLFERIVNRLDSSPPGLDLDTPAVKDSLMEQKRQRHQLETSKLWSLSRIVKEITSNNVILNSLLSLYELL